MADNINISPEMINNLVNMLKNTDANNNTESKNDAVSNTSDTNIDFNNFGNLLSNFTSNSNKNTDNSDFNNNSDANNTSSIDFETILKIKSIMETLNTKNDPRSNLLHSLKPYLRESKRTKLDQYANLLKITQVTGLFKNDKEK